MEQYHVFTNNQGKFLYLTNFKQLFFIPDAEYDILSAKDKSLCSKQNIIIHSYESKLNPEDFEVRYESSNKRCGLFLCIANTCNSQCTYCFAHQGDYGKNRGIMPVDIAEKAIDFFMRRIPDGGEAWIIFFGGEPLMAYNRIVQTCEYVKSHYIENNFQFHIVTNATLLNKERIDYFAQNKFGVAVSIDGGTEVQNKQRPLINHKDSYYEVIKNLDYLLTSIPYTHARGTYCDFSISLTDIYKDLLSLGFREVNVAPDILNTNENKDFHKLLDQLERLSQYILEYVKDHDDFPFGLFTEHIRRLFLPRYEIDYSCGLGELVFSVDFKGDVYPCHRYSSNEDQKIGNVVGEIKKTDQLYTSEQCKVCWNRYSCSHGCSYNDHELTGSTSTKNEYWCKYSQKMTELSLVLCTQLSQKTLMEIMCVKTGMIDAHN